jgi:flagellin-like hook-associated protein FlgL
MIYRTSQRGTYRNINDNLNLLSYRIAQLTNKVASEKSINKPSDNPSGAATVLRTRTVLSEISQYSSNVNYSNAVLTNTGNLMDSVKNTLDEIYSKAEQGSTDTYTAAQRLIIATEIDALFQSIIQYADAKYGDNYLLSGQKVDQAPFSLTQQAQDVVAACENSSLWTGDVQNYGDRTYVSRPDLPVQSQQFLVEVVQPGGIDSNLYASQSSLSLLKINGSNSDGDYVLTLNSLSQADNDVKIRLLAGPENIDRTGAAATSSEVIYSFSSSEPISVVYTYGDSATTTWAQYSASNRTMTVYLQTDGDEPPHAASSVTAFAIASAVSYEAAYYGPPQLPLTATVTSGGTGRYDLATGPGGVTVNTTISFNHKTQVVVGDDEITVYMERYNQASGGGVKASAFDVVSAINNDPYASTMVAASVTGAGQDGTAQIQNSFMSMQVTDPYTLARATTEIKGTHNDLTFYVKNEPNAPIGEAGNSYSVEYVFSNQPPTVTVPTTAAFDSATSTIIVTLGSSGAAFMEAYSRIYNDPSSSGYHDANETLKLAKIEGLTATALDVASAVSYLSSAENLHIGVKPSEGDSGLGKVYPAGPFEFSGGYNQSALFRVSQDGGKTWGPPTAFAPSEFQTEGLYYNSQLGHASLTTNLPGGANDVVFTANYQGTWGDDLRIEYKATNAPNSPASVTVGPQPWNICVNLATDANGQVVTTADDVVNLVSNHPQASQLVTASLANYHEGGYGIVQAMDCTALSTGEPYEIDGRTRITPLGHATATVAFPYSAPDQSSPDLIFQALQGGSSGNTIGIRYTTSADTSVYGNGALYQDQVTIEYETDEYNRQIVVVHLATAELPVCPDPEADREAYDQFKKIFPAYSCTTDRAVTSTAGDVLEALIAKNLKDPDQALVWASMEFKDEGWDSTAKVGPTNNTVWLSGGDDAIDAQDYGIALKFIPDGTALVTGDVFGVSVGWYNGDSKNIDIGVMSSYRTTTNITGDSLLGANGASDNVLDTVQRLYWGLTNNDTELVERELPKLKEALEKVTTMETNVGTKIIRNQFVLNNLELNKYAAETTLSEVEDADFTRLITDLKNSQLVYEAVLGATGLTTKLSLLNYI